MWVFVFSLIFIVLAFYLRNKHKNFTTPTTICKLPIDYNYYVANVAVDKKWKGDQFTGCNHDKLRILLRRENSVDEYKNTPRFYILLLDKDSSTEKALTVGKMISVVSVNGVKQLEIEMNYQEIIRVKS